MKKEQYIIIKESKKGNSEFFYIKSSITIYCKKRKKCQNK